MRKFGVLALLWMLAEIAAFIVIGGAIGVLASLAVILLTAILGAAVLRRPRRMSVQGAMADPARAIATMAGQAMALLAGVLLVLPGFLGDMAGLILLLPPVQALLAAAVARRMPPVTVHHAGFGQHQAGRPDVVIDGEFIELDETTPPRGPSGWTRH